MGEVRPSELLAEGEAEDAGLDVPDEDPQPTAVNGHSDRPRSDDELALFFKQYPCAAEAQDYLRACSPKVCGQVLDAFNPYNLGQSDYSRLLMSFIGKVERNPGGSHGPPRATLEQPWLAEDKLGGSSLLAFRENFPMDDQAFEILLGLPDEQLEVLLTTFRPSVQENYSRSVVSYVGRLQREGQAERKAARKAQEAPASEDARRQQLPAGGSQRNVDPSLLSCQAEGRWEQALAFLEQVLGSGDGPEIASVNAVLGACRQAYQWEQSLALLESMPEMLVVPDANSYKHVAHTCYRAGQWAKAMTLSDDMRQSGVSVASASMGVTFRACEKTQNWTYALVLLDELRKARSSPSALNFKTALLACDQRGRWEHCLRLWQEMRQQGIVPEVDHFNSAMSACKKGKLWEQAISVLDDMEDQATSQHFEAAINTCTENQMWEVALRLLHRMLTVGPAPDLHCFTATITACAKGRADTSHWAYSLLVLEQMMAPEIGATERVGVVPSANTFGEVMSAMQRGRQWEHCLALFAQMQEIGLTPTTGCTHSAMRACDFSTRWEDAISIFEQYSARIAAGFGEGDKGSNMLITICLINSCDRAGQLHRLRHEIYGLLQRNAEEVLDNSIAELAAGLDRRLSRGLGGKHRDRAKEGMTVVGYAHMAFTRLCSLDMQPSAPLQRWRRRVQRTVEGSLRELQPLVRPWGPLPPPGVNQDWIRCMNDLAFQFTGDVLSRMGLRTLHLPADSAPMAAMRRFTWWEIDRLPPDPEGWFVLAAMKYDVALGAGLGGLRCVSKIHYYNHAERCRAALSPVRMMQDRMAHRGWHAERQALLGLSYRMLSRYRALGDEEERKWPRGPVHLYVNHTPCLSCMAVIFQFQGRFPSLSFSVTFDVWQELRAHQQDPWDAIWPRWAPKRPVVREPQGTSPQAQEEQVESWESALANFRARYPMNDRVFQVLCASAKEVQESLLDTFSYVMSSDADDFSKLVMQQIVQLRRRLSPASPSAQQPSEGSPAGQQPPEGSAQQPPDG